MLDKKKRIWGEKQTSLPKKQHTLKKIANFCVTYFFGILKEFG